MQGTKMKQRGAFA